MNQFFPCHRCGTHNVVGAAACSHCYTQLYYNCPHCSAWVDNRYSQCPQCSRDLNWPKEGPQYDIYGGQTRYVPPVTQYGEKKKSFAWTAIPISLFILIALYLVLTAPGSLSATKSGPGSSDAGAAQASTPAATPSGYLHQITLSGPTSSTSPNTSATGVTLNTPSGNSYTIDITQPSDTNTDTDTTTSTFNAGKSSYLYNLWPGWGHCNKGSCQSCTQ